MFGGTTFINITTGSSSSRIYGWWLGIDQFVKFYYCPENTMDTENMTTILNVIFEKSAWEIKSFVQLLGPRYIDAFTWKINVFLKCVTFLIHTYKTYGTSHIQFLSKKEQA